MRRAAIPALLLFAASASATAAQTTRLDATYSVYLTGIPVGRASVTIDLSDSGFSVSGSARTAKFIRILSKGEGSATVRGTLQANRILSSVFSGRYTSSRREQKIEISTENGTVKNISIEPPLPAIDERRVAITKESRKSVVDPLSAALALVSSNADKLSPEFCNRTLPVFDGRFRRRTLLSPHRDCIRIERWLSGSRTCLPGALRSDCGPSQGCGGGRADGEEPRHAGLAGAGPGHARAGADQGFALKPDRQLHGGSDALQDKRSLSGWRN